MPAVEDLRIRRDLIETAEVLHSELASRLQRELALFRLTATTKVRPPRDATEDN
ncbi:hypothetical protein AB0D78_34080 [Streptomyces avermitilis]|uniref:hypothetical protein n=1 Tax=Streptomyces avermitilis TaxID=33903 RepID=UPI0033C51CFB